MKLDAAELLKEALALPGEARAALTEPLLESLDTEIDPDAQESWRLEIQRRLNDINTGAVELIPGDDARRTLRSRLKH